MKFTIYIAWKCAFSEIIAVKKAIEALGEGIWASYTGFHRSRRTMVISAPSEEYKEQILKLVKPIQSDVKTTRSAEHI